MGKIARQQLCANIAFLPLFILTDFYISQMRLFKFFTLIFFGFLSTKSFCQDTARVRAVIQTLTSKEFAGRGYLKSGHSKTARLIEQSYKRHGLKPIDGSYFQELTISQNLFPGKVALSLNKRKVEPAVDFLPIPSCPSVKGRFKIVRVDSAQLAQLAEKKQFNNPNQAWLVAGDVVKNSTLKNQFKPGLWITQTKKLTHSLSERMDKIPSIVVLSNVVLETDTLLEINLESHLKTNIQTQNVVGLIPGTQQPDSFLVVCAHYDHLGKLGKKIYFPGANDNASGTALLLELADWFSKHPPKYSLIFIAFTGEEAGLLGSQYFVKNPMVSLQKIKFLMNLDLLGFGENGATVVNATLHPTVFDQLKEINRKGNYLVEIKARGKAANSDHYPFSEAGVPAFFLYSLGGPGHYHDINDRSETITLRNFSSCFGLIRDFLNSF